MATAPRNNHAQAAWTMPGAKRVCKEIGPATENNPDPGVYGVTKQVKYQAPQFSMGKEPRDKGFKGQGPSPADYRIPSHTQDGPKYHMGVKD